MSMCTQCGNEMPESAKFCGNCGHASGAGSGDTTFVDFDNPTQFESGAPAHAQADEIISQQVAEQGDRLQMNARQLLTPVEPQAVVICLDTSGSTSEAATHHQTRLQAECRATLGLTRELLESASSSYVAVLEFSRDARDVLGWTGVSEALPQLHAALLGLKSDGGTKFTPPLKRAAQLFAHAPQGLKKKFAFMSDGFNSDRATVSSKHLHDMGVEIETFGIAATPREVNERVLIDMASSRDGKKLYHFAGDPRVLYEGMMTSVH